MKSLFKVSREGVVVIFAQGAGLIHATTALFICHSMPYISVLNLLHPSVHLKIDKSSDFSFSIFRGGVTAGYRHF